MSPMVTGTPSPPGLARSRSTIAADASMPWTSSPAVASGRARRPEPMPSSSTGPTAGLRHQRRHPVGAGLGVGDVAVPVVVDVGEAVAVGAGVVALHRSSVAVGRPARETGAVEWHFLDHAAGGPARPEAVAAMLPVLTEGYGNPCGGHALARQARAALDDARERAGRGGRLRARARSCSPAAAPRPTTSPCAGRSAAGRPVGALADRAPRGAAAGRAGPAVAPSPVDADGAGRPRRAGGRARRRGRPRSRSRSSATSSASCRPLADDRRGGARARAGRAASTPTPPRRCRGSTWPTAAASCRPRHARVAQVRRARRASARSSSATACALDAAAGRRGAGARPPQRHAERRRRGRLRGRPPRPPPRSAPRSSSGRRPGGAGSSSAVLAEVPGCDRHRGRRGGRRPPRAGHRPPVPARGRERGAAVPARAGPPRAGRGRVELRERRAQEPSHVLRSSSGVAPELARGALRLSFGWSTTDADVDAAAAGIVDAAARLRAHARDGAPA